MAFLVFLIRPCTPISPSFHEMRWGLERGSPKAKDSDRCEKNMLSVLERKSQLIYFSTRVNLQVNGQLIMIFLLTSDSIMMITSDWRVWFDRQHFFSVFVVLLCKTVDVLSTSACYDTCMVIQVQKKATSECNDKKPAPRKENQEVKPITWFLR